MSIPACIICFYAREDGSYPPTITFDRLEEALYVIVHNENVECVLLLGDVIRRNMRFSSYELYKKRRDSFEHPVAQAIFDILVGDYFQEVRAV